MFTRTILRALLAAFALSSLITGGGGQQIDHGADDPAVRAADTLQRDSSEAIDLDAIEMEATALEVELASFTKCGIKPKLSSAFAAFGCGYVIGEQLSRRWVDPWVQRCWP